MSSPLVMAVRFNSSKCASGVFVVGEVLSALGLGRNAQFDDESCFSLRPRSILLAMFWT
jgi:hypothetical protein